MKKNTFIKKFLETYVNTTTSNPDESYSHIDFDVMITPKYEDRSRIAVFSGDHGIFPIILEITDNPHHIELGYIDVFEPYRVCRRPLFLRECPDEKTKIYS